MERYRRFFFDALRELLVGSRSYYAWMLVLLLAIGVGGAAYVHQRLDGLAVTGMSDQVSWGLYIANFTFLVGVAAAAVMLVIPAYLFKVESIHKVVFVGELLAVAAITMCLLFVTVDMGRPDRFLHLFKRFNWPVSMLSWDVLVLNGYLLLNVHISGYLMFKRYTGRPKHTWIYKPFVYLSVGWAVSIHTVTAFLYCGLGSRPFWNSAVLGPRFLASAFTAGPAFIIIALQLIRHFGRFKVDQAAITLLSKIMTVCLSINLFLMGCEAFTEFYTDSEHVASATYLFVGLHGADQLVPWIWTSVLLNLTAWVILLTKKWRLNSATLNLACVITIVGVWIEKGMGLIVPGFIPTPLGEIEQYNVTIPESLICVGIWAVGALVYTVLLKVAVPVEAGRLQYHGVGEAESGQT